MKIAQAVEDWPTMRQDDVEVAISVSRPAGAVTYILSKVPREERTRVLAELPTLTTDNLRPGQVTKGDRRAILQGNLTHP